ncbi:hypothetical protein AAHE18_04G163900 [Arachis hypogaea]
MITLQQMGQPLPIQTPIQAQPRPQMVTIWVLFANSTICFYCLLTFTVLPTFTICFYYLPTLTIYFLLFTFYFFPLFFTKIIFLYDWAFTLILHTILTTFQMDLESLDSNELGCTGLPRLLQEVLFVLLVESFGYLSLRLLPLGLP